MLIKKPQNLNKKFICEICAFECSNKKDYTRHLSTAKHLRLKMANKWLIEKTPLEQQCQNFTPTFDLTSSVSNTEMGKKTPDHYECQTCGKVYSHLSSLYKHKKICVDYVGDNLELTHNTDTTISKDKESEFKELVLLLLKENKEIQKTFVEMLPHIKGTITSNSHNTTTHNNQFNINMFLNEHCKNAMNLTDFINSLPITNETYDNTIENGLTKTITNMVLNGLNDLDLLQRPIHCTDPARKIMYIKDNDIWERDNELKLLLQGIKTISLKQRTTLNKWQDANLGWDKDENLQTRMTKLVFNSMTNIETDEKETNKIIRAISKSTYLSNDIKNEYIH